jgi:hypothetical protein
MVKGLIPFPQFTQRHACSCSAPSNLQSYWALGLPVLKLQPLN